MRGMSAAAHNAGLWLGRNLMAMGLVLVCLMSIGCNAYFGAVKGAAIPVFGPLLFAGGLAGCELVKYGAAYWIGEHWGRARARCAAALLILLGVTYVSFQAQVGLLGLITTDLAAQRSTAATLAGTATTTLQTDQAELVALKAQPRFASSRQCTNATVEQSITLCRRVRVLERRIEKATGTVEAKGDVGVGDPVVAVIAWFWPADQTSIGLSTAIVIAGIMEIITALGWLAAGRAAEDAGGHLGPIQWHRETDQSASVEKMVRLGVIDHGAVKTLLAYRNERLEFAEGHWLTLAVAYLDYQAWCGERREEPLGREVFGRLFRTIVREHASGDGYTGWRIAEAARRIA